MSREVTLSVFTGRYDTKSKPVTYYWEEWVEEFRIPNITEDKDTFAVVLGKIPSGKSHLDSEVTSIEAIGLDLDGITWEQLEKLCERLNKYEYMLYSTYSHNPPEVLKLRVIIPLLEPVSPSRHERYWGTINNITGGLTDPQTKNVARLYYVHSCPKEKKDKVIFHHNKGKWFGSDDLEGTNGLGESNISEQTNKESPAVFLLTKELLI